MNPARTDRDAPIKKHTAVSQLIAKPRTRKTTMTNTDNTLYSLRRKAIAPVLMCLAIPFIFGEPSGCLCILLLVMNANKRPIIEQTIAAVIIQPPLS